jgi:glutathione S-transferase
MTYTVALQPDFAFVLLAVVGIHTTNMVLGLIVGKARKQFKVTYPNLYATRGDYIGEGGTLDEKAWKEGIRFNRVQRGHQQFLETIGDAYILLVLCGLFYPRYAALWAIPFIVGRFVYAFGYRLRAIYRLAGEALYLPAVFAWIYGLYTAGTAIHSGAATV